MNLLKLGGICQIGSGGTPSRKNLSFYGGTIPWVKISDIENAVNGIITKTEEMITEDGLANIRGRMFAPGTLLFAIYGSIGKTAITGVALSTNQAILGILPNDRNVLNVSYLKGWLDSNKRYFISQGQGVALKNLSAGFVRDIQIPLPSIDDQKRIAHLLGKVEGLIAKHKQGLEQLDDLLKSVFLHMFGDPVRNEKGWENNPCDQVVRDISSGTSYGGEERLFTSPDEIGVLKISAVTSGIFNPFEYKVVNKNQITKTLRFVKQGDFLFSRANTVELVAACCIVPDDFPRLFLPDKLWAMQFNHELIHKQFFNFLLKNQQYRDVVRSLASGGHDSMLNISMKKFSALDIPCPPLPLQNKFSAIVEKVEKIKIQYQRNLTDHEALYGVLSHKAFAGKLDLSRVSMVRG